MVTVIMSEEQAAFEPWLSDSFNYIAVPFLRMYRIKCQLFLLDSGTGL